MANEQTKERGTAGNQQATGKPAATGDKKRTRKEYDHELTSTENFALQKVQRATSALRTINDAIRSGKPVRKEVIDLCFQLEKAVSDMLFSDG